MDDPAGAGQILNIPLISLWVKILTIPYRILYPAILLFASIGVFSVRNNMFDIFVMLVAGIVGYLMLILRFPLPLSSWDSFWARCWSRTCAVRCASPAAI